MAAALNGTGKRILYSTEWPFYSFVVHNSTQGTLVPPPLSTGGLGTPGVLSGRLPGGGQVEQYVAELLGCRAELGLHRLHHSLFCGAPGPLHSRPRPWPLERPRHGKSLKLE